MVGGYSILNNFRKVVGRRSSVFRFIRNAGWPELDVIVSIRSRESAMPDKGNYEAGKKASISIKAVYEPADRGEVGSPLETLTCTVAE